MGTYVGMSQQQAGAIAAPASRPARKEPTKAELARDAARLGLRYTTKTTKAQLAAMIEEVR